MAFAMTGAVWFKDPESCRALRRTVIPVLRTYPSVYVWLPSCGTGEAAYEAAVVFREEGIGSRTRIYATEASEAAVAAARRGVYGRGEIAGAAGMYLEGGGRATLEEYFVVEQDRAVMRPLLRERIVFSQHDLGAGGSFNEFQLVVCVGVLSPLERDQRLRISCLIDDSLCPFGLVSIGRGDRLAPGRAGARYEPLAGAPSFLRKVA
jgi:chemotaxis protein methyltransferase CheR